MEINTANLQKLRTTFRGDFNQGFNATPNVLANISTRIPSSSVSNTYGWLAQIPRMREWLGERVIRALAEHEYILKNKHWELTIGVDRDHIADDVLGQYGPLFQDMGVSARRHPLELAVSVLEANPIGYDGKAFFATDHPVDPYDASKGTYSNLDAAAANAWYLADNSRPIRPIIFQDREPLRFDSRTSYSDENVFWLREFIWGADARYNVGVSLPFLMVKSTQTFTKANFETAYNRFSTFKGDNGKKLGCRATHLCIPRAMEITARQVVANAFSYDATDKVQIENPLKGLVEIVVIDDLAYT